MAVVAATDADGPLAGRVAARLGAVRLARADWERLEPRPVVVWCDADGVALRGPPATAAAHRPSPPPGRRPGRDLLLRALPAGAAGLTVVDATAGWGGDAGVMAAAGAEVVMIERIPALALVLGDAVERWRAAGAVAATRLRVEVGEARLRLARRPSVDVVYLDPMFPDRGRTTTSAAPVRWLRELERRCVAPAPLADGASSDAVGDDAALLAAAQRGARRRVVVKRGLNDPYLAGRVPSGSIRGRTTRFDLYPGLADADA